MVRVQLSMVKVATETVQGPVVALPVLHVSMCQPEHYIES